MMISTVETIDRCIFRTLHDRVSCVTGTGTVLTITAMADRRWCTEGVAKRVSPPCYPGLDVETAWDRPVCQPACLALAVRRTSSGTGRRRPHAVIWMLLVGPS